MRPDDTAPEGAVSIPLRRRDGSVRAYAIVDTADADWANRWRWHLSANGYARRNQAVGPRRLNKSKGFMLHRELLGLSPDDAVEVDHIDRNRLNNRRCNLRILPHENRPNCQNVTNYGGSQYRGVSWHKATQKWTARIMVDGKAINLGSFETEAEAATAALAGRQRLMPYAVD